MISIKTRLGSEDAWKDRLCCDCVYFEPLPFTVGRCARKDKAYPPSICDERLGATGNFTFWEPEICGQEGQFFTAKRQAA